MPLVLLLLLLVATPVAAREHLDCPETIDINQSAAETLRCLRGVGKKRAEALIAYRDAHGPFASPMGVAAVFGEKLALRLRSRLRVGN
jgi:competence protein ComEA